MADFTTEEIERAAKRVREMYARSAFRNEPQDMPPTPSFISLPSQEAKEKPTQNGNKKGILNLFNFKNFPMDSDTTLLLGIILLLSGQSEDELLTLALVYIML